MVKKKKKSQVLDSRDATILDRRVGEGLESNKVSVAISDFLELNLSSQSKSTKGHPQIWLAEEDARRIDVLPDDEILLLARDNEGNISGAAICSSALLVDKATPGNLGTPSTPKSSRCASGTCQVTPLSLAERLIGGVVVESTIAQEPQTPLEVTSISTPSKGFSFARGGGGDVLVSPSSSKTKSPITPRSPARVRSRMVWVIPLQTDLGTKLSRNVCKHAARLELTSTLTIPPESTRIVQLLILANYSGRFLSANDSIAISYQGKPLVLHVTGIGAREDRDLVCDLSNLNIADEDSTASIIMEAVQRAQLQKNFIFFRVNQDTDVILSMLDAPAPSEATSTAKQFVAGLSSTIEHVKELLLPSLLNPSVYGHLKPPRGILMHGPSGVGKSALADEIALLFSTEHKIHVEKFHCISLQSHTAIVGEAERRLSRLFRQSRDTLLIFDDVHMICPKRDGSNPGVDRLAATLLSLLDGISSEGSANIVILAITSNPSALDPAP